MIVRVNYCTASVRLASSSVFLSFKSTFSEDLDVIIILNIRIWYNSTVACRMWTTSFWKWNLLNSLLSMMTCFFLYGLITPLLEETLYYEFLLSSPASTMKWCKVLLLVCLFSAKDTFLARIFCNSFLLDILLVLHIVDSLLSHPFYV